MSIVLTARQYEEILERLQQKADRDRQEAILLSFAHFVATHDVGLGSGARARALQQAAWKALHGDPAWREILGK